MEILFGIGFIGIVFLGGLESLRIQVKEKIDVSRCKIN